MTMEIYANTNEIMIDGQRSGFRVTQRKGGTVVYSCDSFGNNYREHPMPHARYALSHDHPASGAAGRAQFEADIRHLLSQEN